MYNGSHKNRAKTQFTDTIIIYYRTYLKELTTNRPGDDELLRTKLRCLAHATEAVVCWDRLAAASHTLND